MPSAPKSHDYLPPSAGSVPPGQLARPRGQQPTAHPAGGPGCAPGPSPGPAPQRPAASGQVSCRAVGWGLTAPGSSRPMDSARHSRPPPGSCPHAPPAQGHPVASAGLQEGRVLGLGLVQPRPHLCCSSPALRRTPLVPGSSSVSGKPWPLEKRGHPWRARPGCAVVRGNPMPRAAQLQHGPGPALPHPAQGLTAVQRWLSARAEAGLCWAWAGWAVAGGCPLGGGAPMLHKLHGPQQPRG